MDTRDPIRNALWHVERSAGRTMLEYDQWMSARDELVRLATPLYQARLAGIPFYEARMQDGYFWSQFVGSRVNEARALVRAEGQR